MCGDTEWADQWYSEMTLYVGETTRFPTKKYSTPTGCLEATIAFTSKPTWAEFKQETYYDGSSNYPSTW
jgi:hypothetical protein